MFLFHQAVIESTIRYNIWFGNLTIQVKSNLVCLLKIAFKIIGRKEHLSHEPVHEQLFFLKKHMKSVLFCAQYELLDDTDSWYVGTIV